MTQATFTDAYRTALFAAIERNPADYGASVDDAAQRGEYARIVADKMIAAMRAKGVAAVNCSTPTFRTACRALSIKHNQREMQAALNAEVQS